jgi:hypothetical protein
VTTAETTPFLTVQQFSEMIAPRTLTGGESALVGLLVQAAADWIRQRLPELDLGNTQAKLVSYDVAIEALGPAGGIDRKARSITRAADDRTTTVTYADAVAMLDLNQARYSQWLGLGLTSDPQATFDDFAVAFTDRDAYGRRTW